MSFKKFVAAFVIVAVVEWIALTLLFDANLLGISLVFPFYVKMGIFISVQVFQAAVSYYITRG